MEKLLIPIKSQKAFTLIELLITITIIVVVMGVGAASYSTIQKGARDNQRQSDLNKIALALENYYGELHGYPSAGLSAGQFSCGNSLTDSTSTKIFMDKIPCDPLNTGANVYTYRVCNPNIKFNNLNQDFSLKAVLEKSGSIIYVNDANNSSNTTSSVC